MERIEIGRHGDRVTLRVYDSGAIKVTARRTGILYMAYLHNRKLRRMPVGPGSTYWIFSSQKKNNWPNNFDVFHLVTKINRPLQNMLIVLSPKDDRLNKIFPKACFRITGTLAKLLKLDFSESVEG